MSNFLVCISTCIFIYIFYSLSFKQEINLKIYFYSCFIATAFVGVISSYSQSLQ